jgi:hypothetical protein
LHIYDQQVSLCNARTKVGKSLVQKAFSLQRADKGNSFRMLKTKCSSLGANISIAFRVMKRRVFSMAAGGAQSAFILKHTHQQ